MSPKGYILAHDLGTTGNKATLFDAAGHPVASTFQAYPTAYPYPNWAEQDPAHWQDALFRCTRQLLDQAEVPPGDIAVVCFSGHMQGALVVDKDGRPLRPAIIWADQRATAQADRIRQACGEEAIYRLTGHRVSAAYTAAKVLWIKDHQPEVYGRTHKVLQPKDYAATGLVAGTPVVIGGGDGACATVGAGSVREGDAYTYIGSSAWIALSTHRPVYDPQRRTFTFAHLAPDLYFSLGTMQAAGGAYDWLERLLRGDEEEDTLYEELDARAACVPPGAGGVLFLPYLLGERSPHWNPLARGAFVGLAMSHGRAELARAVLEGVALNLKLILDILRAQGVQVEAMRLIGGGARSAVWRQILADVYNLPLVLPALTAEATALGAAVAGGVGVGLFPDFDVAPRLTPVEEAEHPDPARHARYGTLGILLQQTYTALEPVFEELATLAGKPPIPERDEDDL